MKTCFKCGIEKDLSEFYKHPAMADGHLNKCKECAKADVNKHRSENIDRIREYDRNRPNKSERFKKDHERTKERRKSDSLYYKAHLLVAKAVRIGDLIRQDCQVCGRDTNVHAHHDDYEKPLDVMWLCPVCHSKRHQELLAMNKEVF